MYDINEVTYIHQMITIARKYAYFALDAKYKKPSDPSVEEMFKPKAWYCLSSELKPEAKETVEEAPVIHNDPAALKEMIENNPALGKLINTLVLGTDEDIMPF